MAAFSSATSIRNSSTSAREAAPEDAEAEAAAGAGVEVAAGAASPEAVGLVGALAGSAPVPGEAALPASPGAVLARLCTGALGIKKAAVRSIRQGLAKRMVSPFKEKR
jgi:hypothetical protein